MSRRSGPRRNRRTCRSRSIVAESRTADYRRGRRRARLGARAELVALAEACRSRSPPRSTAKTGSPARIRCRSAWSAAIRAKAPTARSTRRSICFIGTETGGMTTHSGRCRKSARRRSRSTSSQKSSAAIIRCRRACWATSKPCWCACSGADRQVERQATRALDQGNLRAARRVVRQIQAAAGIGRGADPSGERLP